MSESAFESLVLSELKDLKEGHKELKAGLQGVGMIAEQALTVSAQTLEQAKMTNGRVTDLEAFKDTHTDIHLRDLADEREAESFAAGRRAERTRAKDILARLWAAIRAPVMTGVFAGVTFGVGWLVVALSEWSPW